MSYLIILAGGAVALLLVLARNLYYVASRQAQLPPGPAGLPLIGNLLQIPKENRHLVYGELSKIYGDIMSFSLFGKTLIVLNSRQAVVDVLERKAAASAGRPQIVFGGELVGMARLPTLTSDMALHRQYRRLYAKALNSSACQTYWPIQMREMRRTVLAMLEGYSESMDPLKQGVASIISEVVYGYQVTGPNDPFLARAREVLSIFERVIRPGAFLVDLLPWLKYVPEWVPGAGFQRLARKWRGRTEELRQAQLERVQRDMAAGVAKPSYVSNLLSNPEKASGMEYAELVDRVKWSAGTMYGAGFDTTLVTMQNFIVAMLLFPEAQTRAQAEIDRVVGRDRLPELGDRSRLPFCQAIVQETLRYRPAVPLGIPHAMMQDEVYSGYRLPRGATIIGNIWALAHDPAIYPDPMEFMPERFLAKDGTVVDGGREAFGFGRRRCPGQDLAENSVFAFVTTLLWAANVQRQL